MRRRLILRRWMTRVIVGVAWGLLCVGTRHLTLHVGRNMQELVAERHEQLARVQSLDRLVADARRIGNLERIAAEHGFIRPSAANLVIVAPEEGLLSRLFGAGSRGSGTPGGTEVSIRSREEVVVEQPSVDMKDKSRRRRRGGGRR